MRYVEKSQIEQRGNESLRLEVSIAREEEELRRTGRTRWTWCVVIYHVNDASHLLSRRTHLLQPLEAAGHSVHYIAVQTMSPCCPDFELI
jgi:hypothetical protein